MFKIGYVYIIYNRKNRKRYIGQCSDINARIRQHVHSNYCHNKDLRNDVKKYGERHFTAIVHSVCLTLRERLLLERKLIKKYRTWNFKYGYNKRDIPPERLKSAWRKTKFKGKTRSQITKMWYDTATPERIAQRQSFMRQDGYKTKISKMIKEKWKNKKYREMMLRARLK